MAAHPAPTNESKPAPEVPLLAIFAGLIVVAVVAIGLMIAIPTTLTLIVAFGSVIVFAILVTWMLARMIGPEG